MSCTPIQWLVESIIRHIGKSMNRIELYASFISDQIDLDEVFGGSDRGYPYINDTRPTDHHTQHFYNIKLPDNTQDAIVDILHHKKSLNVFGKDSPTTATVGFTMPRVGYGLSPEAKETYDKTFDDHVAKGKDHYDAHGEAVRAVDKAHGEDEADKADAGFTGGSTITRAYNSAHHNYRIFSTISKIMNEHGKNHPDIKHFTFSSSGDHKSRGELYHLLAKKHGGEAHINDNQYSSSYGEKYYTIPNPHYKGE